MLRARPSSASARVRTLQESHRLPARHKTVHSQSVKRLLDFLRKRDIEHRAAGSALEI